MNPAIVGYRLCHPVQYVGGEPQCLPNLPDGVSCLEGDVGADHGCIVPPVCIIGILNDLFSSVRRDVDVNIGGAQFIEKTPDEEIVFHGVNRSNAQHIGHDRACRRASPLRGDAHLSGIFDDVPDHEKIS